MDVQELKIAITKGNIEWRKHVLQRMLERDINRKDVIKTIMEGEVIENYESDNPFPSALFLRFLNKRPLHVLVALDEKENKAFIITAYEPNLEIFESDYKTRKKK